MDARGKRRVFAVLAIVWVALLITAGAALTEEKTVLNSWDRGGASIDTSTWVPTDSPISQAARLVQPSLCEDTDDCSTPGLFNPQGTLVILALDDHGPVSTGQALVEQIHTYLGECHSGDRGDDKVFTTGPDDLFPPAGFEDCSTPGLVNLQDALVILTPGDQGPVPTGRALEEQIRTFLGDCHNSDMENDDGLAIVLDELFPPNDMEDCPTIIRLPNSPQ